MNRRNVLVGLGTIVAGGGGALATGAFSSVEADRSVTVDIDKDNAAFVRIEGAGSDFVDTTGDQIEIAWDSSDMGTDGEGGIHQNATITTADAITFTHNGESGQAYKISLESDDVTPDGASITFSEGSVIVEDGSPQTVSLEIETPDSNENIGGNFTIKIEETST